MSDYSKYNVPDFHVGDIIPVTYTWWSWHPLFSRWIESCWKGSTVEEALANIEWPEDIKRDFEGSHRLDLYHNKLIKHSADGYEEIIDMPCKNTYAWDTCLEKLKKS